MRRQRDGGNFFLRASSHRSIGESIYFVAILLAIFSAFRCFSTKAASIIAGFLCSHSSASSVALDNQELINFLALFLFIFTVRDSNSCGESG